MPDFSMCSEPLVEAIIFYAIMGACGLVSLYVIIGLIRWILQELKNDGLR